MALDRRGFVETVYGHDVPDTSPYATSVAGIFAVGDVCPSSVKRVASGVGEGSVVVQSVHRGLANLTRNASVDIAVNPSIAD